MLHYRHSNFYGPVTVLKGTGEKKQIIIKQTDTTIIMLSSLKKETGHERRKHKSTNKKLWGNTHPLSCHPHPDMNQPPPPPIPSPIIHNNNTMDTEFLVQRRQSNKCGSIRKDEIFNLHLGSGGGPWVSIPWLLQDTSNIYWFHPPKQLTKKKKQRTQKWDSTPKKLYHTAFIYVYRSQG